MKRASGIQKRNSNKSLDVSVAPLLAELRELILTAREQVARAVNAGLTLLYWQIGQKVRAEILKEKRAEYGQQVVSTVGRQLGTEFGRGFSEKSLRHMIQFVEAFPDQEIVSTLSRQLAWSHFIEIIYLNVKQFLTASIHFEVIRL